MYALHRAVKILSCLLALDNYVPSHRGTARWFVERELRGGFQLVGCLCAPRSRENSAGKIISLPHSSPQFRAVVYSSLAEDDPARTFFSHRFHGFLSCSFFPHFDLFPPPSPLPPVSSIRYPLADLSSRCPLLQAHYQVPLLANIIRRSFVRVSLSTAFHSRDFDPSYVLAWLPIHRICIRIYERDRSRSGFLSFPVSTFHSSRLLFLFLPSAPSPTTLDLWKRAIWGSSTVICLRRLIMDALLLPWISTSY